MSLLSDRSNRHTALLLQELTRTIFFFQDLILTDDTVLEEHNEDPALVQMRLIGDGGESLCLWSILNRGRANSQCNALVSSVEKHHHATLNNKTSSLDVYV
jgi:hypothetical protein